MMKKIIFDKFTAFTAFFILVIFDHCLYTIMVGSAYFVKSTPPRAFQYFFSILCKHISHILKMCMKNYNDEKIFFDKFTAFLT